jgi:hypothetical protein
LQEVYSENLSIVRIVVRSLRRDKYDSCYNNTCLAIT